MTKKHWDQVRKLERKLVVIDHTLMEAMMAKQADAVYKVVNVIGTSTKSWDDAAKNAVETAGGTLRDLRIAEVVKLDMKIEKGKVRAYRARLQLSFKYGS